jgi:hypothetical protein
LTPTLFSYEDTFTLTLTHTHTRARSPTCTGLCACLALHSGSCTKRSKMSTKRRSNRLQSMKRKSEWVWCSVVWRGAMSEIYDDICLSSSLYYIEKHYTHTHQSAPSTTSGSASTSRTPRLCTPACARPGRWMGE